MQKAVGKKAMSVAVAQAEELCVGNIDVDCDKELERSNQCDRMDNGLSCARHYVKNVLVSVFSVNDGQCHLQFVFVKQDKRSP